MKDRSGLQSRGSAPSTAIAAVSLAMLIAAGMSSVFAQTNSPTAAWIQVGSGTGPAKVSVRAASASGATVTIEIPGIQTESVAINGAQYTKLTIPGAVSTGFGVGKPEVPAVPVLLARPTGSAVTFRVLRIQTETLHVARVFPMQPPSKSGEQASPPVVDASFYTSDVDYPTSRLSSPSLATWRDLDVVNVHVYPVVVRPAQHEVIVTSRITFRADFSGGSYPRKVASWMPPLYQRLIRNYDDLRLTPTSSDPPGTKCLVFCDSAYVDNLALLGLLDTMTMLGDSTELINVPESVPAEDTVIKRKIWERYYGQSPPALRWVFLIGEFDQIPPKADYSRPEWGDSVPFSDYWYSDLTYGLPDFCDNYPEVGIARLSPQSSTGGDSDLTRQVTKIMNYMMGRDMMGMDMTGGWLDTITLVAHRESGTFAPSVSAVCTMSLSFHDYKRDTIMGCWEGFDNEDVKGAVEKGTGVLIYHGHGVWDRWLEWDLPGEHWTTGEVDSLNNQRTPVVFNFACYCGDLSQGTCLSEKWMRKWPDQDGSGYGAVASFGSSDDGFIFASRSQCSTAVRAIGDNWPEGVEGGGHHYSAPVFDLGGMKMLMDADVAAKWDTSQQFPKATMNIYSYMWLGSPAMPIWSGGTPDTAHVTYPSWIPTGDGQPFTVTVKIGGRNVEGAQVCVRKYGDFYVVGTTDASGKVTFSLGCHDTGHVFVSASKGHCAEEPHTPMLPYFGASDAYVGGPDMTYPNSGRKLVREPNTLNFHIAYTLGGITLYSQSTNGGANWSVPETIGLGKYPAIILDSASTPGGMGLVPWVVYVTPEGSIMRAVRFDAGQWVQDTVWHGSEQARAGAPSLASDVTGTVDALAQVVFPVYNGDPPTENYVYYCSFTLDSVLKTTRLDSAGSTFCYGASIALTPGYMGHVAWARGQSVLYRACTSSVWSDPVRISTDLPLTEPASNPSLEAYGAYIYCAWRGPDSLGNLPGDIWRRAHNVNWDPSYWPNAATNQSESPGVESDFPAMTTDLITVWHEEAPLGNYDIWGRQPYFPRPEPFFATPLPSRYPHVDCHWSSSTGMLLCHAAWTEMLDQSSYEVRFCGRVIIPVHDRGSGSDGYEPGQYYAATLGQPEQSPYCLSRDGYASLGAWDIDTSAKVLAYRLPYLDPRQVYKLRAIIYHEGKEAWSANMRCDSGAWSQVKSLPGIPDTVWLRVPRQSYKEDARIILELARETGDYVSLAELKLFQIEEEAGEGGGVQSLGSDWKFVTRLRGCTPNPFAKGTSVNYELAQYGPVELTVHDVTGRAVRCLAAGPQTVGFHSIVWDGKDTRGRRLPVGVYFCRMQAGGTTETRRVTLIK